MWQSEVLTVNRQPQWYGLAQKKGKQLESFILLEHQASIAFWQFHMQLT